MRGLATTEYCLVGEKTCTLANHGSGDVQVYQLFFSDLKYSNILPLHLNNLKSSLCMHGLFFGATRAPEAPVNHVNTRLYHF